MRMAATMALTLPGDMHAASHARNMVEMFLSRLGVTRECRDDLGLIVSEACTNALAHAGRPADVEVHISVGQHECVVDVGNSAGPPHDVELQADLPDPLAESGRGLPIISALADSAHIHHQPGWVVVHTVKRIARD
jgi:serine/threonine-protein kinase RsbW